MPSTAKTSPYRSKFEERIAEDLVLRKVRFKYEHKTYDFFLPTPGKCLECGSTNTARKAKYTPDWFLPNGIIIESKGLFTAHDRKLILTIRDQYPDLDIRMLFMRNNKLHRRAKMRYSDWCDRHGIKYAFRYVPDEWIKERKNKKNAKQRGVS